MRDADCFEVHTVNSKAEWMYMLHMLLCTLKSFDCHKIVCLWGLPFPGRAMKPECILESSALEKWTKFYRHGTAFEKISPTLQEKTSPNSPTIKWSISQKERVVLIHNNPPSTPTYTIITHLYSSWICWVQGKSFQPLKTDSLRRAAILGWNISQKGVLHHLGNLVLPISRSHTNF